MIPLPTDDQARTETIFDPQNLSCPHAVWAQLRTECPVPKVLLPGPEAGSFLLTRKADIEFAASHPEIFSSEVEAKVWRWGSDLGPDFADIFAKGYRLVHTIVSSDPPRAHKYRLIALEALSPAKVRARAADLLAIIGRLLAAIPEATAFDFRAAFTVPLPLQAILTVFGLPLEDGDFVYRCTCALLSLVDPITPLAQARIDAQAVVDAQNYLAARITGFRERPADNFLSYVANWRDAKGELLSMEEALSHAFITLIGGNETTRNALTTAAGILAQDQALWSRLQQDRSLVGAFCEEVVRYGAPATTTPRQTLCDTELSGTAIPRGAAIYMMWGSGSRDAGFYDAPEEFRLDRRNGRNHTSFGAGVHHCAGIHLARAEMIMSVEAWLDAFETFELATPETPITYEPAFAIRAIPELPVRVTLARRERGVSSPRDKEGQGSALDPPGLADPGPAGVG